MVSLGISLDAKVASQLNFDYLRNVRKALVMHNSYNILLAHQAFPSRSWAGRFSSGAHL